MLFIYYSCWPSAKFIELIKHQLMYDEYGMYFIYFLNTPTFSAKFNIHLFRISTMVIVSLLQNVLMTAAAFPLCTAILSLYFRKAFDRGSF